MQAIESGLPHKDVKTMCLKYAEVEKSLGEIDRARGVYAYGSQFSHPQYDADFWNQWLEFEVQNGNEDTFREMLRIKRCVSASYNSHEDIEIREEESDEKIVEVAQREVSHQLFLDIWLTRERMLKMTMILSGAAMVLSRECRGED